METADEFVGEELDWFGAAGEDVVDDVVVLLQGWGILALLDEGVGVLDDGGVVDGEPEMVDCEFMDDRVDFDDCCVDAVRDQGAGGGADSEATGMVSHLVWLWVRRVLGVVHDESIALCVDTGPAVGWFNKPDGFEHGEYRVDGVFDGRRGVVWSFLDPLPSQEAVVASHDAEAVLQIVQDRDIPGRRILAGDKSESFFAENAVERCRRIPHRQVHVRSEGKQQRRDRQQQGLGRNRSSMKHRDQDLKARATEQDSRPKKPRQKRLDQVLSGRVNNIRAQQRDMLRNQIAIPAEIQARLHEFPGARN